MRKGPAKLVSAGIASVLASMAAAQTGNSEFQRVSLDQFMRESLVTQVPISFELPASFAPVDLPKKRPPTAHWLERNYHAEALRTGRMPRQAGHFRGSLAIQVTYDEKATRLLCGKLACEISLREDLTRAGYRVLSIDRQNVGGHPVLLLAAETATGPDAASAPLYQAYFPLRAGTGVVQIVYRPASGLAQESVLVWNRFRESLAAR